MITKNWGRSLCSSLTRCKWGILRLHASRHNAILHTLALSTAAAAATPLGQQFLQGCTCNAIYLMPMSMFTAVFGSRHGLKTGIFASPVLCQLACGAELGDWFHPASSAGVSI